MTEFNRSSTLSVRRTGSALTGTQKGASPASAKTHSAATAAPQAGADRPLASAALLQGRSHVSIVHNGETYQLRATRLGKLILTK
ncbi:hemin uptake protein HemP [Paraburkholderia sp. A1RI-2L]|uniref:hemin uptake protein HemP n=1 Tax=Paraburkholderia sp. A1RI-2L TaxID=3028367 RepID=UPI003B776B6B